MKDIRTDDPPAVGLRERKKAKTRVAIQEHALRLFQEQGYDATTVEQIAEAAEVSPSTFFRYFPTKEDVVLYDVLDPVLIEAFRSQPPTLSPISALRNAFHAVWDALTPDQLRQQQERGLLVYAVPELRAAMLVDTIRTSQMMATILGERIGRPEDDPSVRMFTGALIGAMLAAMIPLLADPDGDPRNYAPLMDDALAYLEAGLPL